MHTQVQGIEAMFMCLEFENYAPRPRCYGIVWCAISDICDCYCVSTVYWRYNRACIVIATHSHSAIFLASF